MLSHRGQSYQSDVVVLRKSYQSDVVALRKSYQSEVVASEKSYQSDVVAQRKSYQSDVVDIYKCADNERYHFLKSCPSCPNWFFKKIKMRCCFWIIIP